MTNPNTPLTANYNGAFLGRSSVIAYYQHFVSPSLLQVLLLHCINLSESLLVNNYFHIHTNNGSKRRTPTFRVPKFMLIINVSHCEVPVSEAHQNEH